MRYLLTIAYQGTDYAGWQRQSGLPTIQQTIEEALAVIVKEKIVIFGAGRTDAGVHAYGQSAHFDLTKSLPKSALVEGLNSQLPPDIRIRRAEQVSDQFHARKSAIKKKYSYYLLTAKTADPLLRNFSLHWPRRINLTLIAALAKELLGKHDFASFQATGSAIKSSVREIYALQIKKIRPYYYRFDITANGFLRHMVRNIVGTILALEQKKMATDTMNQILNAKDRQQAGPTAPAGGLLLRKVYYN